MWHRAIGLMLVLALLSLAGCAAEDDAGTAATTTPTTEPTTTTTEAATTTEAVDSDVPAMENIDVESLTWTRVPLGDFPRPPQRIDSVSTPRAVVEFEGGLVAVGDSMAWTSDDGVTWKEEAITMAETRDVVAGGPGLIAVGSAPQGGFPGGAAVWTSPDGTDWDKAPGQPTETGGGWVNAVVAAGPGFVAVGAEQVFTSESGITWTAASQNLPTEPPFFGWMTDVTTGGPGLVAVGSQGNAAVWTSTNGLEWSRVPDDVKVFGWEWVCMEAVTAGGPGLVAVGHGPLDPIDYDDHDAGEPSWVPWVWTSPDGLSWTRVPHDEAVFGTAWIHDVIAVGDTLIAVGGANPPLDTGTAELAVVWTSTDGRSWQRLPHRPVFDGPAMTAVAQFEDGLVALGEGAAWLATPDGAEPPPSDPSAAELEVSPVDWAASRWMIDMVVEVGPLTPDWLMAHADALAVSGSLIWDETRIELDNLYVRDTRYEIRESGLAVAYVQVGDIFEIGAALADTFDEYGLPPEACVNVDLDGTTLSHCAPFTPGEVVEGEVVEGEVVELAFAPVEWGIVLDEGGPGIHTVLMVADVGPFADESTLALAGSLVWDDVTVDLGNRIRVRGVSDVRPNDLRIGGVFTTDCWMRPAIQDVFAAIKDALDEYGLPTEGCLTVESYVRAAEPWGAKVSVAAGEFCAPLPELDAAEGG